MSNIQINNIANKIIHTSRDPYWTIMVAVRIAAKQEIGSDRQYFFGQMDMLRKLVETLVLHDEEKTFEVADSVVTLLLDYVEENG